MNQFNEGLADRRVAQHGGVQLKSDHLGSFDMRGSAAASPDMLGGEERLSDLCIEHTGDTMSYRSVARYQRWAY